MGGFYPYMNPYMLKQIQVHEVVTSPNVEDLLYWDNGPKGKFSIKSAICIIRKDNTKYEDIIWNTIWSTPIQQRIRTFLWLFCDDRLMGNLNRFKRKLTDSPACFVCGGAAESNLHILCDCPAAKSVETYGGLQSAMYLCKAI